MEFLEVANGLAEYLSAHPSLNGANPEMIVKVLSKLPAEHKSGLVALSMNHDGASHAAEVLYKALDVPEFANQFKESISRV